MSSLEIHKLSPKTVIMISKLVYQEQSDGHIDLHDVNKAIKKLGLYTNFNLDVSFIYEVIQLNKEKFRNDTISVDNIELPELQSVTVDYYRTYSEIITYYYQAEVETYSKKRGIVDNFFNYDGDDHIDIDNYNAFDKEYGDSESLDSGISDIN